MNVRKRKSTPEISVDWDLVDPAITLVREVRELYGRRAAQRLWQLLPLPPAKRFQRVIPVPQRESVTHFLAEGICQDQSGEIQAQLLYQAYVGWCERRGLRAETLTGFGRELRSRGFTKTHRRGCIFYCGVSIIPPTARRRSAAHPPLTPLFSLLSPSLPSGTRRVGRVNRKPSG